MPDRGPDDTALDITGVRQSSGGYSAHEQDPREPCATVGLPGMRVHVTYLNRQTGLCK